MPHALATLLFAEGELGRVERLVGRFGGDVAEQDALVAVRRPGFLADLQDGRSRDLDVAKQVRRVLFAEYFADVLDRLRLGAVYLDGEVFFDFDSSAVAPFRQ